MGFLATNGGHTDYTPATGVGTTRSGTGTGSRRRKSTTAVAVTQNANANESTKVPVTAAASRSMTHATAVHPSQPGNAPLRSATTAAAAGMTAFTYWLPRGSSWSVS